MSLLGSIFDRIFGWTWPWSKTDYYSAMKTSSGLEVLDGTDDDDKYTISGGVQSRETGSNAIDMGDGDDTLTITGRIESENSNEINLGTGDNILKTSSYVLATEAGTNGILAGDGDDRVTIGGNVQAEDNASNLIDLGGGENTLSITWGLSAQDEGENTITTGDDDDCVNIFGGLYAEGQNSIDLGDGDNTLTIRGGMNADGGNNSISSGDGDDLVSIWGVVKADDGGENSILTGGGNDTISLHNTVEAGALVIDAGDGDNVLALNASRVSLFNNAYEDWLTDYADGDGLGSMGIGTFEVTLSRVARGGLADLEWLSDMTEEAGIDLQLNINSLGRNLKLSNFFENDEADVFHILSMEGGTKNTLTIKGSLADNGFDGDELTILGDSKDVVKLSKSEWEAADSPEVRPMSVADVEFQYFSNDEGQTLLIQHDISVLFM